MFRGTTLQPPMYFSKLIISVLHLVWPTLVVITVFLVCFKHHLGSACTQLHKPKNLLQWLACCRLRVYKFKPCFFGFFWHRPIETKCPLPMIINSHLRRSWRCNASAGKHLFHSVHHWTKEGNLDCNLKNYFSPSLQPVVWGVVNDLCRRVDILSRARSRLPSAEEHLRLRWSHLGLSPPPPPVALRASWVFLLYVPLQ